MASDEFPLRGDPVPPGEVTISKARELVRLLEGEAPPFVRLLECRRDGDPAKFEIVVIEVEVELGQVSVHDVRRHERIAVAFDEDDQVPPEVLALRDDFPAVPHLNLRAVELPRSLCLYDEPYANVKLRWTAATFVERIRTWLALTAKGKLHDDDQPLEPLFFAKNRIIVPDDLFDDEGGNDLSGRLTVTAIMHQNGVHICIATKSAAAELEEKDFEFVATAIRCEPQAHGVIRKQPTDLHELHQFTASAGTNFLGELGARLCSWKLEKRLLDARLILVVWFPKTRNQDGATEASDVWAFLTLDTVRQVGERIGVWETVEGNPGRLMVPDPEKHGQEVRIELLNVTFSLSRERAALLSGLDAREGRRIAAIGVGALGSQVALNLVRAGYGEWAFIDDDFLLPHNLTRHALDGHAQGFPKAIALAQFANSLIDGKPIARGIVADVLEPGENEPEVRAALAEAHVIVDFSASIAVARHLARDVESGARRGSLFLNPLGTDLVVLAEDAGRKIPLDSLEMQYYRSLIAGEELAGHLAGSSGRIRYAQSCRDVTSVIPQDLVALQAAIGSRALRHAAGNDAAVIAIWRADENDLSVRPVKLIPAPAVEHQLGEWRLVADESLLEKISVQRGDRLPNETGGILLGSFDLQRKIVYVADTVLSPPDSVEWPTLYIRGYHGLRERVQEIETVTAGMLRYVGEWHSHPDHCLCAPSNDDRKVFAWLAKSMSVDGFPALMAIAGERRQLGWFLGIMAD